MCIRDSSSWQGIEAHPLSEVCDVSSPGAAAAGGADDGEYHGDVDIDFESLASLPMAELQELCETLRIRDWPRMRKCDMVTALLEEVYGVAGV